MSPSNSKFVTILGVALALVSAFADQSVAAAFATVFGAAAAAKITSALTILGVLLSALGRALLDSDGDGTPDVFQGGAR